MSRRPRSIPGGVATTKVHGWFANSKRQRASRRGQAIAELAVGLPLFLMMTIGLLDVARILSAQIALTNAVREGALYASMENNATHWCTDGGGIACPAGAAAGSSGNCAATSPSPPVGIKCDDPDNIAYLIAIETSGLERNKITLFEPTCQGGGCETSAATSVTIRASYRMNPIVPIISAIVGGTVTIVADATAPLMR